MLSTRDLKERIGKLNQLELFRTVLGIPDLRPGKMMRSPIRTGDSHPSFNVYNSGSNRYAFKDFAFEQGSIFDLVMHMHGCDFKAAVHWLARKTGVGESEFVELKPKALIELPDVMTTPAICSWERKRDDGLPMDNYWMDRYGITDDQLSMYGIYRAERFKMTTSKGFLLEWTYQIDMPLYVMEIGKHLKAYRPLANKNIDGNKYIGNTNGQDIFGAHIVTNARPDELILITAGQKDGLIAGERMRGVWPIALNSESVFPDETFMLKLIKTRAAIAVCYDKDTTGRAYMKKLKDRYPFILVINLEGLYPEPEVNDIADAYKVDGLKRLQQHIDNLKNT